jgi:NitT/TauT family transport system substrate-binding protein
LIHNLVVQLLLLRTAEVKPMRCGEPDASAQTVNRSVSALTDMPHARGADMVADHIVTDRFNAVVELHEIGKVLRGTGDRRLNHARGVTINRADALRDSVTWTKAVVTGLAKAQRYARENHQKKTARLFA